MTWSAAAAAGLCGTIKAPAGLRKSRLGSFAPDSDVGAVENVSCRIEFVSSAQTNGPVDCLSNFSVADCAQLFVFAFDGYFFEVG